MQKIPIRVDTISVAIILAVGIYLSFAMNAYVVKIETESITNEFESMVSNYTVSLQNSFRSHRAELRLYAKLKANHLHEASIELSKEDLRTFREISSNFAALVALELDGFKANVDNSVVQFNAKVIDTDLNFPSFDNIEIQVNNNQSSSINNYFYNNITVKNFIPITMPLSSSSRNKLATPKVYIVGLISLESVFDEIISPFIPEWLDMHLYVSQHQSHKYLYGYTGNGTGIEPVNNLSDLSEHALFVPGSIKLGDISLSVLYLPNDNSHFQLSFWKSNSVLIIGLMLTFGMSIYLVSQQYRTRRINQLVKLRTQELHNATEQLQATQREQQIIFDTVPAYIWYIDLNNIVLRINDHAAASVRLDKSEIEGQHAAKFLPKGAADNRDVSELPKFDIIEKFIDRHGETEWLRTDKVPYYNERNEICGVIVLSTNITSLKTATDALKESEERFQLAVEGTNDGIWDWPDISKSQQYWSPRIYDLLGYDSDEILATDTSFRQLLHSEDKEKVHDALDKHFAEQVPYNIEYRLKNKSGEYRWYHAKGNATAHDNGLIRMTGSLSDIHQVKLDKAEKEKMESQLRQAQKLESIGQLAAGIAHEINTPIQFIGDNIKFFEDAFNDISGFIDTVETMVGGEINDQVLQEKILGIINENKQKVDLAFLFEEVPVALLQSKEGVSRVSHIVKAMKEFSHPGSDSKTQLDLNHAIETTITVSKSEWKLIAEIKTDLQADLPFIMCFPGEINQTILNIIVNAAHAIADVQENSPDHKGVIEITTSQHDDNVKLTISDNGSGMPESVRVRIFDPFFTTKEVGKGTGQGLSIAYSVITDKHGGSIAVKSDKGNGTTFIIILPIELQKENKVELKKIA